MADDILVRLRAEADTAQLKEFQRGLDQSFTAARKAGLGLAEANKVVDEQFKKVAADAKYAGKSVQEYINGMLKLDAAAAGMRGVADAIKKVKKETEDATKAHHKHASAIGHVTKELGAMAAGYFAVHKVVHTLIESFEEFAKFDKELRKIQNATHGTDADIRKLGTTFQQLSMASGKSIEDIVEGFEEIREGAHLSKDQAEALLGTITRGAMAANVSVKSMGDIFATAMRNMHVEGGDVTRMMDQLAYANSHLRLNIQEMAGQLPRATEAFENLGYAGDEGMTRMLAWIATLRGVTKTSSEATMSAGRMVEQLTGPGIAHALRVPQSAIEKIVRQAKDNDEDPMMKIADLIAERSIKSGKSIEELLDRIPVRERRLWRAAVEGREKVRKADDDLKHHSEGTAREYEKNFRKGPQQAIDDLNASWTAFKINLGETIDNIGVTTALKLVAELLKSISTLSQTLRNGEGWRLNPFDQRNIDAEKKKMGGGSPLDSASPPPPPPPGARTPSWVPPNYRGTYHGGYNGPVTGDGGAQHFAGGGGFGGGNSIAGRNWEHDLLGGSPMSGNIEDRRATERNTTAVKRLTDIMEDVKTDGGLADQLGINSIGGGGGGGGGGGRAQRFAGGGGFGTGAGTGAGGSGGGGIMGGGGGGGQASGSGAVTQSGGGGGGGTGNPQGSGGGWTSDAMAPAGTPTSAAGQTVEVTTNGGKKVRVAAEYAENFRGFLNDYEAAGGKISQGSTGGLNTRPGNKSYHPLGRAIDVNQHSRNVIGSGLPGGIKAEEELAHKWGLRAGSEFSNPDRGHYEVHNRARARQAPIDRGIIKADGTQTSPGDRAGTGTPGVTQSTGGKAGTIDRSSLAGQLDDSTTRLMAGLTKAETGSVAGVGSKQFLAGHMNRTLIERNATLRNRVFNGYYPASTRNKLNNVSAAEVEQFKKNTLDPVMQGEGGDKTHNASAGLANRQQARYGGDRDAKNELFYSKTGEQEKLNRFRRKADAPITSSGGNGKGVPVVVAGVSTDASKTLTDAHVGAIDKATKLAGGGTDAGDEQGYKQEQEASRRKAQKAAGIDPDKPEGDAGFGRSHFGARHQTGKFDHELDSASGKRMGGSPAGTPTQGFGRSKFGARHQDGKFDHELDKASGKRLGSGGGEKAHGGRDGGSPAGLPTQAGERKTSYNLDKTQFSRRDRQMDKQAQVALHQASENAHADIGVA